MPDRILAGYGPVPKASRFPRTQGRIPPCAPEVSTFGRQPVWRFQQTELRHGRSPAGGGPSWRRRRARGFAGLAAAVAPTRVMRDRSRSEIRAARRWGRVGASAGGIEDRRAGCVRAPVRKLRPFAAGSRGPGCGYLTTAHKEIRAVPSLASLLQSRLRGRQNGLCHVVQEHL